MNNKKLLIPVFPAFLSADETQYLFWCDECLYFHRHGANSVGHRVAHCPHSDSAYKTTYCGYELVHRGTFDDLYSLLVGAAFSGGQVKRALTWRYTSRKKSTLRHDFNVYWQDYMKYHRFGRDFARYWLDGEWVIA
jgi:hypothetical protein